MSNATTKPEYCTVKTNPNDGMKNAKRWEGSVQSFVSFPTLPKNGGRHIMADKYEIDIQAFAKALQSGQNLNG
ncbi:hypothetical protein P0Y67_22330, partial [Photobacterium sp. SP02]|uniref:hypothetical protein n=1 Tax=Photobacterium sp. SP02 TaxID=3032280 RepID=UPI003144E00B